MLSDPDSAIIRRFALFNENTSPDSRDYGIPHPGVLLVDAAGIVRERFFNERYYHRTTMPAALSRLGMPPHVESVAMDHEHLQIRSGASDATVFPGSQFTLFVDVIPLPGVHIYGQEIPGGYQGLEVTIEQLPYLTVLASRYPEASPLTLAWTDEELTGYTNPLRVTIDVALGTRQELAAVLEAGGGVTITGTVKLQACDDRICWAPDSIPTEWHVDLRPPDLERSPEPLQHKPKG